MKIYLLSSMQLQQPHFIKRTLLNYVFLGSLLVVASTNIYPQSEGFLEEMIITGEPIESSNNGLSPNSFNPIPSLNMDQYNSHDPAPGESFGGGGDSDGDSPQQTCLDNTHQNNLYCIVAANTQFSSSLKTCVNKLDEQLKLKVLGTNTVSNPEASYGACKDLANANLRTAQSMCTATVNSQKDQCKKL